MEATFNATVCDFWTMPRRELRALIDACHRAGEYDAWFEQACCAYNTRFDLVELQEQQAREGRRAA